MSWHDYRGHVVEEDMFEKAIKEILKDLIPEKVYHSRRYYNNGDYIDNGVLVQHLEDHIDYNCKMRPGTALFIEGLCVNKGYLSKDRIDGIAIELKRLQIKIPATPIPYE